MLVVLCESAIQSLCTIQQTPVHMNSVFIVGSIAASPVSMLKSTNQAESVFDVDGVSTSQVGEPTTPDIAVTGSKSFVLSKDRVCKILATHVHSVCAYCHYAFERP